MCVTAVNVGFFLLLVGQYGIVIAGESLVAKVAEFSLDLTWIPSSVYDGTFQAQCEPDVDLPDWNYVTAGHFPPANPI
jgi:hypothetical protein